MTFNRTESTAIEAVGNCQLICGSLLTGLPSDREGSTVFVADLPANTVEDDLKALFKDVSTVSRLASYCLTCASQCGSVREIKITQLLGTLVATVEFMDRVSCSFHCCHLATRDLM